MIEKLEKENGINMQNREVMVTSGANQAFFSIIQSICDVGDEVVLFRPYYFNQIMALQLLGINPIEIDCNMETLEPLIDTIPFHSERLKAVVLVSPSNPSGFVASPELVHRLTEMCAKHSKYLISDETYEDFVYEDAKHTTPLGSHVINIYSFSK